MIWLAVCYLVGAYIRQNGVPPFCLGIKAIRSIVAIAVNTILITLSVFFLQRFNTPLNPEWLLQYNSPFIVINSILIFNLFRQNALISRIVNQKVILEFSAAAFDVYIIHCHILIYDHLIKDAFTAFADYHAVIMVAAVLVTILMIYIICLLISKIRKWLFRVTGVTNLTDTIGKVLDQHLLVN